MKDNKVSIKYDKNKVCKKSWLPDDTKRDVKVDFLLRYTSCDIIDKSENR